MQGMHTTVIRQWVIVLTSRGGEGLGLRLGIADIAVGAVEAN